MATVTATTCLAAQHEEHMLRRLYWQSFAVRVGVGVLAWVVTVAFELPFMEDAHYYDEQAQNVAYEWEHGRFTQWIVDSVQAGKPWIMFGFLAIFYVLTGGLQLLPLIVAMYCLAVSWTPVIVYRTVRKLGHPPPAARVSGLLLAFSPSFVFWSGALYKEGLILLVISLQLYHTLNLQERFTWKSLWIVLLGLPVLFGLRFYLAMMMAVVIGAGLCMGRRSRYDSEATAMDVAIRQLLVIAVLLVGTLGMGISDIAADMLPGDLDESLARMQVSRVDLAATPSGYLPTVDISSTDKALSFLPVGIAYFLSVPLPWHWGSLRQNLIIPESLFWLVLVYPAALLGLGAAFRRHFQGTILIVALIVALCCYYGLMVGNIGTAVRMRTQVWLLVAIFAGIGWRRYYSLLRWGSSETI
jgi:hypothetical protein